MDTGAIADELRAAFDTYNVDRLRALMAPDATWGDDFTTPRACRSSDDIVATYERLLDGGVRGRVVGTTTGPKGVACRLEVEWPDPRQERGPELHQVFLVDEDGKVFRIEGHDTEAEAIAAISD